MVIDKSKIFIAYSRKDSDFALKLSKDLRERGLNIWLDQLNINPGEIWDIAIENSLKTCETVIIILSPSSVSSLHVMDELSFAFDEDKNIIPVLYLDCEIPFRLRRRQFSDFTNDYIKGFNNLLKVFSLTIENESRKIPSSYSTSNTKKVSQKPVRTPTLEKREVNISREDTNIQEQHKKILRKGNYSILIISGLICTTIIYYTIGDSDFIIFNLRWILILMGAPLIIFNIIMWFRAKNKNI